MSDVNQLLEQLGDGWTLYDESEDTTPKSVTMGPGLYPAHITKVEIVERDVLRKFKAKIYNLTVVIADDAKNRKYKAKSDGVDCEVDGSSFVGKEIRSQGVFKFLAPTSSDSFQANPGGNKKYMSMVEALGIKAESIEVEINGEKRNVKKLPDINEEDLLGKPMIAGVGFSKPWKGKDGKERQTLEVKSIRPWAEGTEIDLVPTNDDDDIPF